MTLPPSRKVIDWEEMITRSQTGLLEQESHLDRVYFVVFRENSSFMFPLPVAGEISIGRTRSSDLVLPDSSVSRRHARMTVAKGEVHITDLESQNGTCVNGERIEGTHQISCGDVIAIGNNSLVFHASGKLPSEPRIMPFEAFRRRFSEELERAFRYGRSLALISMELEESVDLERVSTAAMQALRLMDVVGWGGPNELLVLVPEMGSETVQAVAQRLLDVLREQGCNRAGFSSFPTDGSDVEGLLGAVRGACRRATTGKVQGPVQAKQALEVGGQRIVVADPAMERLYALTKRLAASDLPVLISGETGTGKELVAKSLHAWSKRTTRPLVTLNCAAIHENLLESELFGYERGAFSGAAGSKPGLLETGNTGTVFLDEIGEMPAQAQAKLLRVLETKRVTRLGDVREREIDIRIVAATNRNLEEEVSKGRFRKDLFFRLSGAQVWLPPLRDRKRELTHMAEVMLEDACRKAEHAPMALSDSAIQQLMSYAWPGNVRELRNLLEYVVATVEGTIIEPEHIIDRLSVKSLDGSEAPEGDGSFKPIEEEIKSLERKRMVEALSATSGNQTRAAKLIQMPLRTFVTKLKLYGLAGSTAGESKTDR